MRVCVHVYTMCVPFLYRQSVTQTHTHARPNQRSHAHLQPASETYLLFFPLIFARVQKVGKQTLRFLLVHFCIRALSYWCMRP